MANPIKYNELFDNLGPGSEELKDFTTQVQALNRNYKAFAKGLEGDGERVKTVLAALSVQAGTLKEQAAGINLVNEKERAGMAALTAEATKLAQERQRLEAVLAAQAKAQRVVNDATREAQSALRAMQNELREAYAAQDTARIEKAAASIRQYKTETAGLSAALRGTNSELTAARGSYDALDLENKKLIVSLRALQNGLGGGGLEAAKLEKQIADNTQTLKTFDERILNFSRNVGNYAGSFEKVVAELAKARAAQASMSAGTEDYNRSLIKVQGFQTAAQKSAAQMGLSFEQAEAKINGVIGAIQPLTTDLVRLEREQVQVAKTAGQESEAYQKLGFEIQATRKKIDDIAVATTHASDSQNNFTQQLGFSRAGLKENLTQLAVGAIGFQALVSATQSVVQANIEYSRNLAEVRKTTGLTADEADRLGNSLKQLDTPTTLAGLLKIASVGGQLGIAKGDLLEFTKAIDTAVQALGNDFAGGAEEIATTLGKLSTVYRKELGPDVAQNILALGSAVNELGAVGAATSPQLTDVASRVGAISSSTGVGLKNVLAYAAVLLETGSTSEVAGTALNRFFNTLTTRTKESYEIAKLANPALTLKEFTHLVNTDFNQAIQVFLKGLKEGGKSTTDQARLLGTLKLQSGEAKNAIITLSQQTDLYAERQKTANDQLRDASSLAKEAAVNTDTLAGSVDKNLNGVKNFFTSGAGGSVLKFLIDIEAEMVKIVAVPFKAIGDGISYLGQKVGLIDKPLTDYTTSIVANTLAARKQVSAQQDLLKSYAALEGTGTRSAAQELELAKTRAEVLKQFGTTDSDAIQASIDKRRAAAESNIQFFKNDITQYDALIAKTQERAAAAQNALNQAPRTADGNPSTFGGGQQAAEALRVAEKDLTEQQRLRGLAVAALAKLEGGLTQAKKDGTAAAEAEASGEEQLDRTQQERAKNRVKGLKDELADNQINIDLLKKYQAEQGKLFEDKQLSTAVFAENVAGSQALLTKYERDGTQLRIAIAHAESVEKLKEADNDRIRQSKKKDITEAELTDIQGQYAARRKQIAKDELRAIETINREAQQRQGAVEPLEFKVVSVDIDRLKSNLGVYVKTYERSVADIKNAEQARSNELTEQLTAGLITQGQFEDRQAANRKKANDAVLKLDKSFHQATIEEQNKANAATLADQTKADEEDLAERRRVIEKRKRLIDSIGGYTQEAESAFFAIKGNFIEADIQRENESYEQRIKVAGDNAALRTQIEENHEKRLKKLNYDKAKAERDQAAISVAISTAVAVAKAFAEYVFPFALIPAGIALAEGALQEAVILSKPLPSYFKGRESGPAEIANLGEQGTELAGQPGSYRLYTKPSVGYLGKGDKVFTAQKTQEILAQNELVEGRLVQRQHSQDMERQTVRLRSSAAAQQARAEQASHQANDRLIGEVRQVRRAVESQEQLRVSEEGLRRWKKSGDTWQQLVNERYLLK